ncbi:Ctr copper transporter [Crepidotus variabilis]|uniref:Copper transport protein n=1 Tax=Crepidotus variabilis TaxID=179855 RepID=A0A9P6EV94_9AGAR|nr:Ctr copper transporter [Crepidotus variabilis]
MDGMDHGSSGTDSSSMMVPYLHFAGGDNLLFKAWAPKSSGTIAGACIGLAVLAILERWVHALRSIFTVHWHTRALAMCAERDRALMEHLHASTESERDSALASDEDAIESVDRYPSIQPTTSPVTQRYPHLRRTVAPFIAAFDVPRGLLYIFQMILAYTLMLAVMTFQAAYIIAIIVGLGLGEILFGRAGHLSGGH